MTDTLAASKQTHTFHTGDRPWWERCEVCKLGEAAHRKTVVTGHRNREIAKLPYRCPDCVSARDLGQPYPHEKCPR